MKKNEEKNVYVQPDCKVYQVKVQQMVATSGEVSPQSSNEEYETGSTEGWF